MTNGQCRQAANGWMLPLAVALLAAIALLTASGDRSPSTNTDTPDSGRSGGPMLQKSSLPPVQSPERFKLTVFTQLARTPGVRNSSYEISSSWPPYLTASMRCESKKQIN
uniref:Secreted protein n=1 Tax=Anopheles melas TaxID=34690 RepID=A0A182UF87_9DIPT